MSCVLVVEDNDKNLKLIRTILEGNGIETVEARTGEEALALVRGRKPDLILMDIQLPGLSGIDVLNVLRADADAASIPVLAVTASVMSGDVGRIMAAGFGGCISKPVRYAPFLAAVRSALAGADA
jgi:two-component system cell cycle response regulator DivK